jgi:hypothetical protein
MIGHEDAASALAAIDRTRRRSFELRGYAQAGDIVICWGLVWLICNLSTYFAPGVHWAWPAGVVIGTLWSAWRGRGQRRAAGKADWRGFATAVTIAALVVLVSAIAGIDSADQGNALISAFVAGGYVLQGIWSGPRIAWIGIAIAGFVFAGWFLDRAHLDLWLGLGGGGALILSGLWLRRA